MNPRRRRRLSLQRSDHEPLYRFEWDADGNDGQDVIVGWRRRVRRLSALAIRQSRRGGAAARAFLAAYRLKMVFPARYELAS